MADGVYTAMDAVEAAALESAVDGSHGKSELDQLRASDDPVLGLGQTGDSSVRAKRRNLVSYIGAHCDLAGHGARLTAAGAPGGYEGYGLETEQHRASEKLDHARDYRAAAPLSRSTS